MSTKVCPTCGTPVSQIKAREIEAKLEQQQGELEKEIKRELCQRHERELQAATKETEKRIKQDAEKRLAGFADEAEKLRQTIARMDEKRLQDIEAASRAAARKATDDANKRIATIAKQNEALQRQTTSLQAREAMVKKRADEDAERRIRQAQEQLERRVKTDAIEQRRTLEKHYDGEKLKQQASFNRERESYQKKFIDMQRQLERKTANDLGDGAEIDLFDALYGAFPDDTIRRVTKGTAGADIIHDVRQKGQCCGRIVYDSKNHQRWLTDFVTKLRHDQKEAEAEYAVLSTSQFPKGERVICVQSDVIIVSPAHVVQVVRVLRSSMIKLNQLGLSSRDRDGKVGKLYSFITSEKFIQRLSIAEEVTGEMEELDVQEKKAHDKTWKERGILNRRLAGVIAEIDTEISGILQGIDLRPAA
jgi:hypothetical protein